MFIYMFDIETILDILIQQLKDRKVLLMRIYDFYALKSNEVIEAYCVCFVRLFVRSSQFLTCVLK